MNSIIEDYRLVNPTDKSSDDFITWSLGSNLRSQGIPLESFPDDFREDFLRIERSRRPGLGEEFKRGLARGTDTLQSTLYAGIGAAGEALGLEPIQEFGVEGYLRNIEEAAQSPASLRSYTDIAPISDGGIGDAIRFGVGLAGEVIPSVGESVATGLAGAAIGTAAGSAPGTIAGAITGLTSKSAIKSVLLSRLRKEIGEEAAESVVQNALKSKAKKDIFISASEGLKAFGKSNADDIIKDVAKGAASRSLATKAVIADSIIQNTGATYGELSQQDVSKFSRLSNSILAGSLSGALDSLLPAVTLNKLFGSSKTATALISAADESFGKPGTLRNFFAQSLEATGIEGTTESLQELIQELSVQHAIHGNIEDAIAAIDPRELKERMINAGLAGMVGGGVMGVPAAGITTIRDRKVVQRKIEDPEKEIDDAREKLEKSLQAIFEEELQEEQANFARTDQREADRAFSQAALQDELNEELAENEQEIKTRRLTPEEKARIQKNVDELAESELDDLDEEEMAQLQLELQEELAVVVEDDKTNSKSKKDLQYFESQGFKSAESAKEKGRLNAKRMQAGVKRIREQHGEEAAQAFEKGFLEVLTPEVTEEIYEQATPEKSTVQEQPDLESETTQEEGASTQSEIKSEGGLNFTIDLAVDEEGAIDYEAEDKVRAIAKDRDLGITSDREIAYVARNKEGQIIGGAFSSFDGQEYTFDIVVAKEYEGQGVGSALLDEVIEPGEVGDLEVRTYADVVSPSMKAMLERRGWSVESTTGRDRWNMVPPSAEERPTETEETEDTPTKFGGLDSNTPLYHGTPSGEFEKFTEGGGRVPEEQGVFFTTSKDFAKRFAEDEAKTRGGTPRVIEARAKLKNPYVLDETRPEIKQEYAARLQAEQEAGKKMSATEIYEWYMPDIQYWAQANEHDGIVVRGDSDTFVNVYDINAIDMGEETLEQSEQGDEEETQVAETDLPPKPVEPAQKINEADLPPPPPPYEERIPTENEEAEKNKPFNKNAPHTLGEIYAEIQRQTSKLSPERRAIFERIWNSYGAISDEDFQGKKLRTKDFAGLGETMQERVEALEAMSNSQIIGNQITVSSTGLTFTVEGKLPSSIYPDDIWSEDSQETLQATQDGEQESKQPELNILDIDPEASVFIESDLGIGSDLDKLGKISAFAQEREKDEEGMVEAMRNTEFETDEGKFNPSEKEPNQYTPKEKAISRLFNKTVTFKKAIKALNRAGIPEALGSKIAQKLVELKDKFYSKSTVKNDTKNAVALRSPENGEIKLLGMYRDAQQGDVAYRVKHPDRSGYEWFVTEKKGRNKSWEGWEIVGYVNFPNKRSKEHVYTFPNQLAYERNATASTYKEQPTPQRDIRKEASKKANTEIFRFLIDQGVEEPVAEKFIAHVADKKISEKLNLTREIFDYIEDKDFVRLSDIISDKVQSTSLDTLSENLASAAQEDAANQDTFEDEDTTDVAGSSLGTSSQIRGFTDYDLVNYTLSKLWSFIVDDIGGLEDGVDFLSQEEILDPISVYIKKNPNEGKNLSRALADSELSLEYLVEKFFESARTTPDVFINSIQNPAPQVETFEASTADPLMSGNKDGREVGDEPVAAPVSEAAIDKEVSRAKRIQDAVDSKDPVQMEDQGISFANQVAIRFQGAFPKLSDQGVELLRVIFERLFENNPDAKDTLNLFLGDLPQEMQGLVPADRAGAFIAGRQTNAIWINTNSELNQEDGVIYTVLHEMGHFASNFLVDQFELAQVWMQLSDAERAEAWSNYLGERVSESKGAELKNVFENDEARTAMEEWLADNFVKVALQTIKGDTAAPPLQGNFVRDSDGFIWPDGSQRQGDSVTVLNEPVYSYGGLYFTKSEADKIRVISEESHPAYGKVVRVVGKPQKRGPYTMYKALTADERLTVMDQFLEKLPTEVFKGKSSGLPIGKSTLPESVISRFVEFVEWLHDRFYEYLGITDEANPEVDQVFIDVLTKPLDQRKVARIDNGVAQAPKPYLFSGYEKARAFFAPKAFSNPYPFQWSNIDESGATGSFETADGRVITYDIGDASEFGLAPGFKEINFDEEGEFSKTGKGDAFRIFSTIFAMTKDYVDMYDEGIRGLQFTAATFEGLGRSRLYERLVSNIGRLLSGNWIAYKSNVSEDAVMEDADSYNYLAVREDRRLLAENEINRAISSPADPNDFSAPDPEDVFGYYSKLQRLKVEDSPRFQNEKQTKNPQEARKSLAGALRGQYVSDDRRGGTRTNARKRAQETLVEWARQENRILSSRSVQSRPVVADGSEHLVRYDADTERVIKTTKNPVDVTAYLESLLITNQFLQDDIRLEGLVVDGDNISIVTSQPLIKGESVSVPSETEFAIGNDSPIRDIDAKDGDFIRTEDGRFVPVGFLLKSENQRTIAKKLAGDSRVFLAPDRKFERNIRQGASRYAGYESPRLYLESARAAWLEVSTVFDDILSSTRSRLSESGLRFENENAYRRVFDIGKMLEKVETTAASLNVALSAQYDALEGEKKREVAFTISEILSRKKDDLIKMRESQEKARKSTEEALSSLRKKIQGRTEAANRSERARLASLQLNLDKYDSKIRATNEMLRGIYYRMKDYIGDLEGTFLNEIVNGSRIVVPDGQNDQNPGSVEFSWDNGELVLGEREVDILRKQYDWLNNPENKGRDPFLWNIVKAQYTSLAKMTQQKGADKAQSIFFGWWKPIAQRLKDIGHSASQDASRQTYLFEAIRKAHINEAKKLGSESDVLRLQVVQALGLKEESGWERTFSQLFDTPMKRYMEQQGATLDGAILSLKSRPETFAYLDQGGAAAETLLRQYIEQEQKSSRFFRDIVRNYSSITDTRLKMPDPTHPDFDESDPWNPKTLKSIERPPLDLGTGTFMLRPDVDYLKSFVGEMQGGDVFASILQETDDAQQILGALDRVFQSDVVRERFLESLIYTEKTPFFVDQEGEPLPSDLIVSAYEQSETISDFFEAIGAGEDNYEVLYRNIQSLNRALKEAKKVVLESNAEGSVFREGPRVIIDARQKDYMPSAWLNYRQHGATANGHLLGTVSFQAAFGKNGRAFLERIQASKNYYENVRQEFRRLLELPEVRRASGSTQIQAMLNNVKPGYKSELEAAIRGKSFVRIGRKKPNDYVEAKLNELDRIKAAFAATFSSETGPVKEESTFISAIKLLAAGALNGPRSAFVQFNSIYFPSLYYGRSGTTATQIWDSGKYTVKSIFGSVMNALGLEMQYGEDMQYFERLANVLGESSDRGLGFKDIYQQLRSDYGADGNMATERVRRGIRIAGGLMQRGVSHAKGKTVFPSFNIFAPFRSAITGITDGAIISTWKSFDTLASKAIEYVNNTKDLDPSDPLSPFNPNFSFSAESLGYKNSAAGFIENERAYDAMIKFLADVGISLEQVAITNATGRTNPGQTGPFTNLQYALLAQIATSQITSDADHFTSRPSGLANTTVGRIFSPLLGWAIQQPNNFSKLFKDAKTSEVTWRSIGNGLLSFSVMTLPFTLAFGLFMDWFDEVLLGKKSQMRKLTLRAPLGQNALAVVERFSRWGPMGLPAEAGNLLINVGSGGGDLRDLSLDQRILFANSIRGIIGTVGAWSKQGYGIPDYASVVRPMMMNFGMNGPLQVTQMVGNIGLKPIPFLSEKETRVNRRTNANNWLRASGRVVGLEVRSYGGGGYSPTKMTPQVSKMILAAMANDRIAFREAYRDAVNAARKMGKDDPEDAVKTSYQSRHPLKSLFKTPPTPRELQEMFSVMGRRGSQDVNEAIRLYNAYGESLGITPYLGKKDTKTTRPVVRQSINPFMP